MVLHGYSGNSFSGLPSAISASIYANGHQLRSGIALGHYEFVLQAQGLSCGGAIGISGAAAGRSASPPWAFARPAHGRAAGRGLSPRR
ncbi:MAG: hypothetical protein ACKO3F_08840 [Cyanobium sp.]